MLWLKLRKQKEQNKNHGPEFFVWKQSLKFNQVFRGPETFNKIVAVRRSEQKNTHNLLTKCIRKIHVWRYRTSNGNQLKSNVCT
jgi:hypothetical protein